MIGRFESPVDIDFYSVGNLQLHGGYRGGASPLDRGSLAPDEFPRTSIFLISHTLQRPHNTAPVGIDCL